MHTNPNNLQIAANQAELDGIIARLEATRSDASALLLEHLKCAKVYLQGGMPEEYVAELEMARKTAAAIPDQDLRQSTRQTIEHLRKDLTSLDEKRRSEMPSIPHRPLHDSSSSGSRLWDFFGSAPVKMGTFYPTSFVAAVLPSYAAVENALNELRAVGFGERDVIAVRGEEMSAFLADLRDRSGAWGQLMASLSRMIGTEQLFTDVDRDLARSGAGFLFVYSPDEGEARLILRIIKPFGPRFMQRYLPGAVEGLIKPAGVKGPER